MVKRSLFFLTSVILFLACGGGNESDGGDDTMGSSDTFNRSALLENIADNIVLPGLTSFQSQVNNLSEKTTAFTQSPNIASLEELQASFIETYKVWQHVEMVNIGEAENIVYAIRVNNFPTSTAEIEANIASNEDYDLSHPNNFNAQGFPALDYLLYGLGADNEATLAFYSNDGYKTYLIDVVTTIAELTENVVADWSGSSRDSFVNDGTNTATSSFNLLVNDFIFYYEKGFRANKIGIPAGVWSDVLPESVEAFHNGTLSVELASESLQAIEDFFNGKSYNSAVKGESFKTYLIALDREDVVEAITSQISVAKASLANLNSDLTQQLIDDKFTVLETYNEIQKVTTLLKTDMLSAFDVSVDFVDADGD